jgi:hypothetical protein
METAVRNYATYRRSPHAWMLGRFVVPASRLDEMTTAMRALGDEPGGHHWRLSALVGDDVEADARTIAAFRSDVAVVDAVEVKAASAEAIRRIAPVFPGAIKVYVEIPVADDPRGLIGAIGEARLRAKIRTGGVVAEALPPIDHVARFLRSCYAAGVAFKATAGLHHPVRAERALTYEKNAPRGVMHGFLNVFLAAAFHYNGLTSRDADALLRAESLREVEFGDDHVAWREYRLSREELTTIRRRFAISFGSCSFREPVEDLIEMKLLS